MNLSEICSSISDILMKAIIMGTEYENYFFEEDMEDIIKNFKNRLEEAEYVNDLIYIFEEEVEKKMKEWGTYKPLEQMMLVEFDEDGNKIEKPFGNWHYNPNFKNDCVTAGMETDGFTLSFINNYNEKINVYYYKYHEPQFRIKKEI
jgi:hypothetical protein